MKDKDFFISIDGMLQLLDYKDVYALSLDKQILMEKLFNKKEIIQHSIGNIINSKHILNCIIITKKLIY